MEIQPVSRWFIYNNPQITGDYVLLGWVLGLATKMILVCPTTKDLTNQNLGMYI
jgi:hypothetical protein